jgi:hypothetical protein
VFTNSHHPAPNENKANFDLKTSKFDLGMTEYYSGTSQHDLGTATWL